MHKRVYLVQDDATIGSGYEDSDSDFEKKSVIDKDSSSEDSDAILGNIDGGDFDTDIAEGIEGTTKVKYSGQLSSVFKEETS